ncbi:DUF2642 domain-containing protein [Paenibacillus sp. J2TS4]|uniref:DUF2642 domain-containing protein n=1 Tax=Paenibacillus sp. J2TS4 TaxID=2807194 RepID=UPI001B21EABF|nr:DUF2642 domain-containing protein [Paenibacillus sp. J2TS4]GIP31946.1 hypothetical protein J2TS4_11560 [Paenibacillus sp. J2TS4]
MNSYYGNVPVWPARTTASPTPGFGHSWNTSYINRSSPDHAAAQTRVPQEVTIVKPKFMEHLMEHKGKKITVMTTGGKVEGKLDGAFIDHLALTSHDKKYHILYHQIIYFV